MKNKFWLKIVGMLVLTLLLLIPLQRISSLIQERESRQQAVTADIAASSAGQQKLFGPVLVIPYSEEWPQKTETHRDSQNLPVYEQVVRNETRHLYVLPEQLQMTGELSTEIKQRSLFKVRSYVLDLTVQGQLELSEPLKQIKPSHEGKIQLGQPYLGLAIADMRGLIQASNLTLADKSYLFEQGAYLPVEDLNGMHAMLPDLANNMTALKLPFSYQLKLRGIESLAFIPSAKQTQVALNSAWPHPSFYGRFLPDLQTQQIGETGFHAEWLVNAMATNIAQINTHKLNSYQYDNFGVRLMEPINIYSLSDRATKYGFLFVCLTFVAIFLFEVLKKLAIHPAQYTLVGLALAMFFLLLLSLSEHLDFVWAYLIATCACVSLITVYLAAVLHSRQRGLSAGGILAVLFACLYGLLESEDNALVLGSLLMFCLLSIAMFATRKLDWYRLQQNMEQTE